MQRRTFLAAIPAAIATPPVVAAPATPGSASPAADYGERLRAEAAGLGVTGASFAYWDGRQLHCAVAGLRNSVTDDPVTVDTVMHIGSITKILTTTLLMQLVDEGRIALDDPVIRHLPELRLRDRAALRAITCRMLVNHTSGIDCDMLDDFGPDRERIVDLIGRCADFGQIHPPGGGPAYSNIGVCIAGYLVEKLRGRSWYSSVEERIFRPLGMNRALVDVAQVPHFRASIGDVTNPDTHRLVQHSRPFFPLSFAACGTTAMMTAQDLVTFARAHAGGGVGINGTRILSAASAALMTRPTAKVRAMDAEWGLGWSLLPGAVLSHSGGGPGVRSILYVHQPSGRAMALLTNCDRGEALLAAICDPILADWTGRQPAAPAPALAAVPDPAPYLGTFGNNLQTMLLAQEQGQLVGRTRVNFKLLDFGDRLSPPVALVPIGPHRFEMLAAPQRRGTEILFSDPDRHGRMTRMFMGARLLVRHE